MVFMKSNYITLHLCLCICLLSCFAVQLSLGNAFDVESEQENSATEGTTSIVVVREQARLYLYEGDRLLKSYPVSVGNAGVGKATPAGRFVIVTKIINPTMMWRSGKVIPPNDPRNSYGARWIGLARATTGKYRGYGIQGTNVERSIGKPITLGSIQMHNRDIIELFDRVDLGAEVVVR
jgi:lipoprotein-anchoring transpeptidase ErfK/SrfK